MPSAIMSGKKPGEKSVDDMTTEELRAKLGWVPPYDPRFPNTNQTRRCYQNYLDYHRCIKVKGEKHEPCNYFKKSYEALCHSDWFERWDEQRASGTFPGKI